MRIIQLSGLGLNINIKEFDISSLNQIKKIISSDLFDIDNYLWQGDNLDLFENIKSESNINVLELDSIYIRNFENFDIKINKDSSCKKYILENHKIYWIEVSLEFQDYEINLNLNDFTEIDLQYNLFEFDVLIEKYYEGIKLVNNFYHKKNKIKLKPTSVGIERKDLYILHINSNSEIDELFVSG